MDKNNGSKVEFPAPEGYMPPEHQNEEWDQVCSFKAGSKEGHLCMTKLGEHPMPGYDEGAETVKEAENAKPSYKGMTTSIVNQMEGGQT